MSLDESLREELKRLYLTGHDIGDAGYPEPHKTDDSYIDASLAKIKALIVEAKIEMLETFIKYEENQPGYIDWDFLANQISSLRGD